MLIINKPRLPPIHLNRPTAAFEPDSAAPRLVLRLQWACFGGLVGRLGLLMINNPLYLHRGIRLAQNPDIFHQIRADLRVYCYWKVIQNHWTEGNW